MESKAEAENAQISLRQVAYRRFKEALFSGRIKPGDFLSQREIVELLGVPLGPVREALKSLESEGIATLLPKRGIRIIRIEKEDFAKAIQARKLIEGEAAAKFAAEGPAEAIADLEKQTKAFKKKFSAIDQHDDAIFREKNRVDFLLHDTMVAFLDNTILSHAFQLATEHVRIFRLNVFANDRVFELPAIEEHLKIIKALKNRNPEAARAALEVHLDGVFRRAMPIYGNT